MPCYLVRQFPIGGHVARDWVMVIYQLITIGDWFSSFLELEV